MSAHIPKTSSYFMKMYCVCLLCPPEHFLTGCTSVMVSVLFLDLSLIPLLLSSTEDDAVPRFVYLYLPSVFRQITRLEDFAGPLAPFKFRFWLQQSFGIYELLIANFLPSGRTPPDWMRFPWAFEPWYMAPRMPELRCQFDIYWDPKGLS